MKFLDLKNSLAKKVYSIYFISGEDRFLVQKSIDMLTHRFITSAPELNLQVCGQDYSMQSILENAQTFPFGSEYRLILIKNPPEKLSAEENKLFENYIQNPVSQTILAFVFDEKTDFYSKFSSKVELIECDKMTAQFLSKYVATLLNKKQKNITMDAVDLLIEFCDNDLVKIENECAKLVLAVENSVINKDDIIANVSKSVDYQIYELCEAIACKDSVVALQILNFLFDRKVSVAYILGVIISYVRRLFYCAVSEFSDAEIAKELGVKEYAIKMTRNKTKNFKKIALKSMLEKCLSFDFNIKKGKIDAETGIYSLVLELIEA